MEDLCTENRGSASTVLDRSMAQDPRCSSFPFIRSVSIWAGLLDEFISGRSTSSPLVKKRFLHEVESREDSWFSFPLYQCPKMNSSDADHFFYV